MPDAAWPAFSSVWSTAAAGGEPNAGGAHLTYPVAIPQGRGIAPDLQLAYDSGGGNSWTGIGWDLSVGDVSVDTTFGAPRFDRALETESYALDGERLVPNGLDGSLPR